MFTDFYDDELIKLGGQDLIERRKCPLEVSTQFNLLSSCGFKVPNFYSVSKGDDICRMNRANRANNSPWLVLSEPSRGYRLKPLLVATSEEKERAKYIFEHIEAEDNLRTRYYIIAGNIFKFDIWFNGSASHPYDAFVDINRFKELEFSDFEVCDLSDRRHKEVINLVNSFYPLFSIDLIQAVDGEEYAVGFDCTPRLLGTPLENIATANQLAKALLRQ